MPHQVPERAPRDPIFRALAVVVAVALVLPVWVGRYVPLLDYPNHLSMVFVWFHLHDPQWNFEPYYTTSLPPLPYWAHYGTCYALSFLVGPEIAQKLFLSATVLAFPFALSAYAAQVGRDPRLGLLAAPFAWGYSTANGFLSYVAGIPALLLALCAFERFVERPDRRRFAFAALGGASLYFFHVLPWALFLLLGALSALATARSLRGLAVAASPTVPAAVIGVVAYRLAKSADTPFNPYNARHALGFGGPQNDLFTNLSNIPGYLLNTHPGMLDELVLLVIGLCWLVLLAGRGAHPDEAALLDERTARGWRVELSLLATLVVFLLLPRSLTSPFYWYGVNGRVVMVVALFALLLPRGRLDGARRVALLVAVGAGLFYCGLTAWHFHGFNRRAHGFDEVMAHVPPHAQVLPIMLQLGDPDVSVNAYNQWGTYVQLHQGGYMQFNFVSQFPIKYTGRRLPSPPWDHNELFSWPLHSPGWDWFVVRGPGKVDPFAGVHDKVRLVAQSGDFALWKKLAP